MTECDFKARKERYNDLTNAVEQARKAKTSKEVQKIKVTAGSDSGF